MNLMKKIQLQILTVKADKNIVIIVCPLNSIMEDPLKVLQEREVTANVLQLASDEWEGTESLFHSEKNSNRSNADELKLRNPGTKLLNGNVEIVFPHPKALLSKEGGELMKIHILLFYSPICCLTLFGIISFLRIHLNFFLTFGLAPRAGQNSGGLESTTSQKCSLHIQSTFPNFQCGLLILLFCNPNYSYTPWNLIQSITSNQQDLRMLRKYQRYSLHI